MDSRTTGDDRGGGTGTDRRGREDERRRHRSVPLGRAAEHAAQPRREAERARQRRGDRRGDHRRARARSSTTTTAASTCCSPTARTLPPIAFRGEYFAEYEEETLEELVTQVGEGMTGWVAETGRSLLTPNAQEVEFAVQIEGTDDIVESMLLVPTKLGRQGQRGDRALQHRVREVRRAGPAGARGAGTPRRRRRSRTRRCWRPSVTRRRPPRPCSSSRSASSAATPSGDIFQEAIETIPSLVPCAAVGAYVRDEESGNFRVARLHVVEPGLARPRAEIADVPAEVAASFLFADLEPFIDRRRRGRSGPSRSLDRRAKRARSWSRRCVGSRTGSGRS